MTTETLGLTLDNEGVNDIAWNVMGQIYVPKQLTEHSFAWRATFPAGTFVPLHAHDDQEEYLFVLAGTIDVDLNGETKKGNVGDLIRLPRGIPHAFYNNSEQTVETLFWVAPSADLFNLFTKLDNLTDPETAVRISREHGIHFV